MIERDLDATPAKIVSLRTRKRTCGDERSAIGFARDVVLHEAWFLGGRDLPRWAGYKVGYAIARAYLERHPNETAASLATMPAAEILSGSAYDPMRR